MYEDMNDTKKVWFWNTIIYFILYILIILLSIITIGKDINFFLIPISSFILLIHLILYWMLNKKCDFGDKKGRMIIFLQWFIIFILAVIISLSLYTNNICSNTNNGFCSMGSGLFILVILLPIIGISYLILFSYMIYFYNKNKLSTNTSLSAGFKPINKIIWTILIGILSFLLNTFLLPFYGWPFPNFFVFSFFLTLPSSMILYLALLIILNIINSLIIVLIIDFIRKINYANNNK